MNRRLHWDAIEPKLIEGLGAFLSRKVACERAGVSVRTLERREKSNVAFAESIKKAESRGRAWLENNMVDIARQRNNLSAAATMSIFLAKCRLGYVEQQHVQRHEITALTVPTAGPIVHVYIPDNGRGDGPPVNSTEEAFRRRGLRAIEAPQEDA